jgi:hypothetical protein
LSLESSYKTHLVERLEREFPGCLVVRLDPRSQQGIPDILVLLGTTWFALEVKRDAKAAHQPNQDYWVDKLYHMSYAAFIYPENEDEVFGELQRTFQSQGSPRFP